MHTISFFPEKKALEKQKKNKQHKHVIKLI